MVAHKQKKKAASRQSVAELAASLKRIDVKKLATEQGVQPLRSIDDLVIAELKDEDADAIFAELRAVRRL